MKDKILWALVVISLLMNITNLVSIMSINRLTDSQLEWATEVTEALTKHNEAILSLENQK